MGLFSKIKEIFSKKKEIEENIDDIEVEEVPDTDEAESEICEDDIISGVEEDIAEIEEESEEETEDVDIEVSEVPDDEEAESEICEDDIEEVKKEEVADVQEVIESADDETEAIEALIETADDSTDEVEELIQSADNSNEEVTEIVETTNTQKKEKKSFFGKKEKKKELTEEEENILKYDKGLEKTRKEFVSSLSLLGIKFTKIDDDYFDELEEILIKADIGVNTVFKFIDRLKGRVKHEHITDTKYLNEVIVDELFTIYVEGESLTDKIHMAESGPTVILMVGVNGVGKTTTIGKLAHKYISQGLKVMLIAADTFRAGAVPQLEEWATRTGAEFYGKENTDPAGVIFDGLVKAKEDNVDLVLVDTAGRLQNKVNLMAELEKMNKVIERHIPGAPHETLLVVDATTGQNGISQAKEFKTITNITGIVLTKLDGTAKGGIVLAIKEEVGIPVKFIGLGEGMNDLKAFDIEDYIYGLFKDMI